MRKHGYAATDYVIISAVVLAAVIPFLFIAQEPLRSAPQANLDDAIESVTLAAQRLNRLADDSADRVAVVIPVGVEGNPTPVISDGILRLRIGGQEYTYVFTNVEGRFPTNPGRQFVYLRKVRDKVHVYPAPICGDGKIEGLEQCELGNPQPQVCLQGCNGRCRCACNDDGDCIGQNEGYICSPSGECVPCENDGDCNQAIGESCINGRCVIPPTPTRDCRLPGGQCPINEVCDPETGKCSSGLCPPAPPAVCSVSCPCTTRGESCNAAGQCVPACEVSGCTPPETCNTDISSRTYGQCVRCTNSNQCDYFPIEVCDLDPSSPTHRKCRPCVVGELQPCQPPGAPSDLECKEVSLSDPKTICGNCLDNNDCTFHTDGPVCDPIKRRCTQCYWGFYHCSYGEVCVNNQCVPLQSPPAVEVSCGSGAPGQPTTYCNPYSCPGGKVCMRQGGGCRCVDFAQWWSSYRGSIPPQGRPDPGNPGPQPGPQGNPATGGTPGSSGCRYNPLATLAPGDPSGNSLCADRNLCPPDQECVLTGPVACSCQPDGTPSYLQKPPYSTLGVVPQENVWAPYSVAPLPGGAT